LFSGMAIESVMVWSKEITDNILTTLVISGMIKLTEMVILVWKGVKAMYSNFHKLNEDKRELIINAAINEFVQKGFDQASTNKIVQSANISKGSLFNYFYSKKDLYIYLIDYGIQVIDDLYDQIDLSETDLFKRIENIGLQKLRIQKKYPHVFDFLASS